MSADPPPAPSLAEATRVWARIGCISFGGPAAQIALLHDELVVRRRWLSEARFQSALRFCTLLPGPEAQQLATCCGWYLHGLRGGLVAGILFFLPAALLLAVLGTAYMAGSHLDWVAALFGGLQAAVLALIAVALVRFAGKALHGRVAWILALAALGLSVAGLSFPWIILGAALAGAFLLRPTAPTEAPLPHPPLAHTLRLAAGGLLAWAAPVALAALWLGPGHVLTALGLFFSKSACVTFGGAYAILPYCADHAVQAGWVRPTQAIDALALAETTPGPLIIVLEALGLMAAWNHPGPLAPWQAGLLGAALTVWTTFVPSTLFALLGAPWLDRLSSIARLRGALAGISAAVVGVISAFGVWALLKAGFPHGEPRTALLGIAVFAFALLQGMRWPLWLVLALCAGLGLVAA